MAHIIKKYIYLSGAKSNDPLQIYVPNIMYSSSLRFQQKGTQGSLKRYESSQKSRRRSNVTAIKIFTAPYSCNNSRMAQLHNFNFFHNVQTQCLSYTQFYYFSNFKIANLDRKRFDFSISILFMKGSQRITTDVNICFIS